VPSAQEPAKAEIRTHSIAGTDFRAFGKGVIEPYQPAKFESKPIRT
jgi:hypothetical protein